MAQSKVIRDQGSNAKRIATSINKIVERFDWDGLHHKEAGISKAERAVLVKAAAILSKISSNKTIKAKSVAAVEIKSERLREQARKEAVLIIESWPAADTNLEKIAFSIVGEQDYSLQYYLREGLPIINSEPEPKDWLSMLDNLVYEAKREMSSNAAYEVAFKNKAIEDVMKNIAEKIAATKNNPLAITLTKSWVTKINP